MIERLHEIEFETRTIGPLVLTTPVFQCLDFRGGGESLLSYR
jgi:hypothetical protein